MAADDDAPEIHERFHRRMIDWALRCAYLTQDADTFDEQAAMKYEAAFDRSFGVRLDSNVQRKHRSKRPNTVKSNW